MYSWRSISPTGDRDSLVTPSSVAPSTSRSRIQSCARFSVQLPCHSFGKDAVTRGESISRIVSGKLRPDRSADENVCHPATISRGVSNEQPLLRIQLVRGSGFAFGASVYRAAILQRHHDADPSGKRQVDAGGAFNALCPTHRRPRIAPSRLRCLFGHPRVGQRVLVA